MIVKDIKVKEMIKELSHFNPEAELSIVVGSTARSFEICYGFSEGCTKANCKCVDLLVDSTCEREG